MSSIPTAEEFFRRKYLELEIAPPEGFNDIDISIIKEFTKLHCEAQAKAICEKAETKDITEPNCKDHTPYWGPCVSCGSVRNDDVIVGSEIDKESIINAYPLTNIQ